MAGESEEITPTQEEINNALIQGQATNTAAIAAETTRAMAAEKRIKMCINYRGTVANTGLLPATGNTKGDFFFVSGANHWYLWEGTAWVDNGVVTAGMSAYDIAVAHGYTGTEAEWIAEQAKWAKLGNVPDGTTAQAEITALGTRMTTVEGKIGDLPAGQSVAQALSAQTTAVTQQLSAQNTNVQNQLAQQNTNVQNLMSQAVKTSTDQVISGNKTFSNSPVVPTVAATSANNSKAVNVETLIQAIQERAGMIVDLDADSSKFMTAFSVPTMSNKLLITTKSLVQITEYSSEQSGDIRLSKTAPSMAYDGKCVFQGIYEDNPIFFCVEANTYMWTSYSSGACRVNITPIK